jgi:hypothetical protein
MRLALVFGTLAPVVALGCSGSNAPSSAPSRVPSATAPSSVSPDRFAVDPGHRALLPPREGTGPRTVSFSPSPGGPLTVLVECLGVGALRFSLGQPVVAGGGALCNGELRRVSYQFDSRGIAAIQVRAASGQAWRLAIELP